MEDFKVVSVTKVCLVSMTTADECLLREAGSLKGVRDSLQRFFLTA
jgi:hypothetical protein